MRQKRFSNVRYRLVALWMLCAATCGCAALGGAGADQDADPYQSMPLSQQIALRLDQGKQHKEAGRIEEAIGAYKAVLALAPGNVDARNALAMLLAMNGDLEGAARELAQAVKDQPHVPWLLSNLGHVYILQGRKRDAQMMLTKALARDPSFEGARVNLERADAMPDDDFQERALRLARDKLSPKSPMANTRIRIVALRSGERDARLLKAHLGELGLNAVVLDRTVTDATGKPALAARGIRILFRRGFGEAALLIGRQLPGQPLLEPSQSRLGADVRVILGRDSLIEFVKSMPDHNKLAARTEVKRSARR